MNLEKRSQNITARFVDVNFDRILNFHYEHLLPLALLEEQFPLQRWSPQASGIEIQEEYVYALHDLCASNNTGRVFRYDRYRCNL